MIYRFLIASGEVDNFVREIKIDSEATFLDLHRAILRSVGYSNDEMYSFFTCDDEWNKQTEITLVDMGKPSDEDVYLMEDTQLDELIEDDQRLLYVFDYMTERAFFIELREIITGKSLSEPICSGSEGTPPPQSIDFKELESKPFYSDIGENFYGDSEYDIDELDSDGYDGMEDASFDDDRY
ncbi:MAG: plasmid pRiA4b ORF-3 family protein [Tannerellaceae bacterium]|jgi:hypothetical protein|nr:plasmid pRiA4b ORF-3 family protein [Tannerellaceae bacterium]